ncbi:MAG: cobalt ECF transporter T component CbiQ [Deltaproteobacteria bacterium]|nr:cobalt ECF transporter T component CbiQ [Candidatus Zymogenaceae bacterium]
MKHHFLDHESEIPSPIRGLNPKTKFIALVGIVFLIVSTSPEDMVKFALYSLLVLVLLFMSNIGPRLYIKRLLVITPFVLVALIAVPFVTPDPNVPPVPLGIWGLSVSRAGLFVLFGVTAKATLAILLMTLLLSSTPFTDLLTGLREMKIPSVMTDTLSFMYHYQFLLIDEMERISRARDARMYGGRWIWHAPIIGYVIGALFLRSLERGERTYLAMKARGYDSSYIMTGTERLTVFDYLFLLLTLPAAAAIRLWGNIL